VPSQKLEISGGDLERLLHKLMAFQKYRQMVERRGYPRDIVEVMLDVDARDKNFFGSKESLDRLAARLTTPARTVSVVPDEEHSLFTLSVEDRANGYHRHQTIGLEFVTAAEYRTLLSVYREIKMLQPPMSVATLESAATDSESLEPGTGGETVPAPGASSAGKARGKEPKDTEIKSLDELVEYFLNAGKRGIAINRYKGLGEMNPEQLWATTMNPEVRTLLQVRAEDHTEADQMFTTLMGDQVEPRRKFIEDNALDVKSLDI
jgi:DNA gyrase subunit B